MLRPVARLAAAGGGGGAATLLVLSQQSTACDESKTTCNTTAGLPASMRTTPSWARAPPTPSSSSSSSANSSADSSATGGVYNCGPPAAVALPPFAPPGLQLSDSFDRQPLDEDDECAICLGDAMPRSGEGCCALDSCAHRFHRACVTALRHRGLGGTGPLLCPVCQPDAPPRPWEDGLRQYAKVSHACPRRVLCPSCLPPRRRVSLLPEPRRRLGR